MWHILSSLTNFAIHTTQPLDRWRTTIAIMLEKDKGSPKINRLRVIGKYEADYNLLLKLYWPKLTTQHAEREGTLGKSQMGTRPHKSSNDASVINELIVDTCRIQKCILTIKQNDASACYDRIIANHSSLNSRREGTPKKVCQLRVNTLNTSKHHVQTSLGVSKQYYTHSNASPIHGSGQGTGSAGTEWALISIPIIKVLEKQQQASQLWIQTTTKNGKQVQQHSSTTPASSLASRDTYLKMYQPRFNTFSKHPNTGNTSFIHPEENWNTANAHSIYYLGSFTTMAPLPWIKLHHIPFPLHRATPDFILILNNFNPMKLRGLGEIKQNYILNTFGFCMICHNK